MSEAKDNIQPDKIDNITKAKNRISELEAEKAELIECIEYAIDQLGDLNYNFIYGKDILKKHGVEI